MLYCRIPSVQQGGKGDALRLPGASTVKQVASRVRRKSGPDSWALLVVRLCRARTPRCICSGLQGGGIQHLPRPGKETAATRLHRRLST